METEQKSMTRTQAIAEGYEYCGNSKHTYQSLVLISELNDIDLEGDHNYVLAAKFDDHHSPTIEESTIKDLIANEAEDRWYQETHDDTKETYNIVMALDLSEVTTMINKALENHWYLKLTDIKLIP